jgi:hypothetical protein
MRAHLTCLLMVLTPLAACTAPAPPAPAEPQLAAKATIRDMMHSIVDPSADVLFESVHQVVDEKGIRDVEPRTDEEWATVRSHALILLEAPNLMTMEGRKVANPEERAEFPEAQLNPAEIQKMIDGDPSSFKRRAKRLQDAAAEALTAIDAKDKTALFKALTNLDHACENCHLHYWYPNDKRAWEAAKEEGLVVD